MPLSDATRDRLQRISTATVATCLFKRGLRNRMIQGALRRTMRSTSTSRSAAATHRSSPAT